MEKIGINWPLLFLQVLNIFLILIIPIFDIMALRQLGRRPLSESVRVLWVIVILFVPILGAVAFWLVRPGSMPGQAQIVDR